MSTPAQSPDSAEFSRRELRLRAELNSAVLLRLRAILPLLGLLYVVVTASQFMLLGWTLTAPLVWGELDQRRYLSRIDRRCVERLGPSEMGSRRGLLGRAGCLGKRCCPTGLPFGAEPRDGDRPAADRRRMHFLISVMACRANRRGAGRVRLAGRASPSVSRVGAACECAAGFDGYLFGCVLFPRAHLPASDPGAPAGRAGKPSAERGSAAIRTGSERRQRRPVVLGPQNR